MKLDRKLHNCSLLVICRGISERYIVRSAECNEGERYAFSASRFQSRYRKFPAPRRRRVSSPGRRFIMKCRHVVLRRLGDYLIFVSRQDFAYDRVCHRLAVCKCCRSIWEARDSIRRRPYVSLLARRDTRGITDPRRVNLQGFRPPLNRRSSSVLGDDRVPDCSDGERRLSIARRVIK